MHRPKVVTNCLTLLSVIMSLCVRKGGLEFNVELKDEAKREDLVYFTLKENSKMNGAPLHNTAPIRVCMYVLRFMT